jgi:hypothetical protein
MGRLPSRRGPPLEPVISEMSPEGNGAAFRRAQSLYCAAWPSPIDCGAGRGRWRNKAIAPYELIGAIPVERMREANYMLDRDTDKATAAQAAQFLARATGIDGK